MSTPPKNILINKVVDVIEIHSNTNLVLETNTQIKFNTNNLLINYIPFDQYIRNVVFGTSITSTLTNEANVNTTLGVSGSTIERIDLTNNTSELIIDELHCSGINANTSYVNTDTVHYINLSATNNIILNNISDITNIIYNNYSDSTEYSLNNYIYKIVNSPNPSFVANSLNANSGVSGSMDISQMGNYIGRRLISSNITTSPTVAFGNEPILNLTSATAINFVLSAYAPGLIDTGYNIYLGNSMSISLDSYVKSQLDETPRDGLTQVFYFDVDIGNGETITMSYNELPYGGFSNALFGNTFEYSVVYNIFNETDFVTPPADISALTPLSTNLDMSVKQDVYDDTAFIFDNLTSGNFYRIYADITNLITGTIVNNVGPIETNIATIPHITNIVFTINNDNQITFTFTPHAIIIAGFSAVYYRMGLIISGSLIERDESDGTNPNALLNTMTPSPFTFVFPFNGLSTETYGVNYIKANEEHVFKIVSYHIAPGTFRMSSSEIVVSTTDLNSLYNGVPIAPTTSGNIIKSGSSYIFTFSPSTQSVYQTGLIYNLYHGNILIGTTSSSPLTITSSNGYFNSFTTSSIINSGSYSVSVTNIYGTESGKTNFYTLYNLTITGQTFRSNGNMTFTITWDVNYDKNGYTSYINGASIGQTESFSTTTLSTTTNTFTITATDGLGRQQINSKTVTITPVTVLATLSNLTYHGYSRIFKTTISSTQNNAGLNNAGVSSQTINKGASHSTAYSNNITTQYFQLPNISVATQFDFSVIVKDNWGYSSGIISKFTIIPIPSFDTISNTIAYNNIARQFICNATNVAYQWSLDGTIISDTSNIITLSNSQTGLLGCTVTQTNVQGFTKDSNVPSPLNVSYSTIIVSSFTIDTTSTYSTGYTLSSGGTAVLSISTSDVSNTNTTTFVLGTMYYLWGTTTNAYGFVSSNQYSGSTFFYYSEPNPVTNISYSKANKDGRRITLTFTLGDHGIPVQTLSTTRVYYLMKQTTYPAGGSYHIDIGNLDSYAYITIASSGSTIIFPAQNELYKIRIVKIYGSDNRIVSDILEVNTKNPVPGPVTNVKPLINYPSGIMSYSFDLPTNMLGYTPEELVYSISIEEAQTTEGTDRYEYFSNYMQTQNLTGYLLSTYTFINSYDYKINVGVKILGSTSPFEHWSGYSSMNIRPVNPTVPIITVGTTTKTQITLNFTLGDNGDPIETPSSIKLYYHTSTFTIVNVDTTTSLVLAQNDTSKTLNLLDPGVIYYFAIVKTYSLYGSIISIVGNQETIKQLPEKALITFSSYSYISKTLILSVDIGDHSIYNFNNVVVTSTSDGIGCTVNYANNLITIYNLTTYSLNTTILTKTYTDLSDIISESFNFLPINNYTLSEDEIKDEYATFTINNSNYNILNSVYWRHTKTNMKIVDTDTEENVIGDWLSITGRTITVYGLTQNTQYKLYYEELFSINGHDIYYPIQSIVYRTLVSYPRVPLLYLGIITMTSADVLIYHMGDFEYLGYVLEGISFDVTSSILDDPFTKTIIDVSVTNYKRYKLTIDPISPYTLYSISVTKTYTNLPTDYVSRTLNFVLIEPYTISSDEISISSVTYTINNTNKGKPNSSYSSYFILLNTLIGTSEEEAVSDTITIDGNNTLISITGLTGNTQYKLYYQEMFSETYPLILPGYDIDNIRVFDIFTTREDIPGKSIIRYDYSKTHNYQQQHFIVDLAPIHPTYSTGSNRAYFSANQNALSEHADYGTYHTIKLYGNEAAKYLYVLSYVHFRQYYNGGLSPNYIDSEFYYFVIIKRYTISQNVIGSNSATFTITNTNKGQTNSTYASQNTTITKVVGSSEEQVTGQSIVVNASNTLITITGTVSGTDYKLYYEEVFSENSEFIHYSPPDEPVCIAFTCL
jgi:hypothetical protein